MLIIKSRGTSNGKIGHFLASLFSDFVPFPYDIPWLGRAIVVSDNVIIFCQSEQPWFYTFFHFIRKPPKNYYFVKKKNISDKSWKLEIYIFGRCRQNKIIWYHYWASEVKWFRTNRTPCWFMCQREIHFHK